jgi:2-alkyl-3-oxoalkanoate reductase
MRTTVALTGATGFIGKVIARQATNAGWHVRGLVRSPRQTQQLRDLGIEPVLGTLENSTSLQALVKDCVGVIHCAAAIRGIRREDFHQTNVIGVSNMIKTCLEQPSPPRFVLLSSLAARQPSLSPYAWSKHEGESVITHEAGPIEWSIFRPPAVYGPQNRTLLALFALIRKGIGVRLGPSHAKFSLIHVDDLARAVLHWLDHDGPPFHTYEIDDGYPGGYSWDDVCRRSNPQLRVCISISPILLHILAKSNEIFARLFAYAPLFTSGKVAELLHPDWVCDNAHIGQSLGWAPQISLEEGIRHLFASDKRAPLHQD